MKDLKGYLVVITGKFLKQIIPLAIAVACILMVSIPVSAADIDPDRTGSVSVQIKAYTTDEAVGGGSLNLYHIAGIEMTETMEFGYCYTDNFLGCSEDLLTADEIDKAETADIFSEWVDSHDIEADETTAVSANGYADFTDLSCGLYMVRQNEAADGYNPINAFLVSVPLYEDSTWIYDVDATPKTSPVKKTDTEEPRKDEPRKDEPETTPPGTQNPDGNGGNTGGARTGDDNYYFLFAIALMSAAVILVVIRRRYDSRHVQ